MPLASSRSSSGALKAPTENRMSLPSTITSTTKVTRKKVAKRRASLRGRDPSPAPFTRAAGKENVSSPKRKKATGETKAAVAPDSPGPTPYWVVAAERASQGKNAHSPRQTRSATKKTRPRLPPFGAPSQKPETSNRGGGTVLSFSPPDQELNRRREEERLTHRHEARDGRVQNARDRGQYLEFSPRSGKPRQSFDDDEKSFEDSEEGGTLTSRRRETAVQAEADILTATRQIFRNTEDDNEMNIPREIFRNVGDNNDSKKNDQVLKSIQENMHKLMQAKSFDENEQGRHVVTLEADNKNLINSNEKLQQTVESLELERKELQDRMSGIKERLLMDTVKLESEVTSIKREAETNQMEKEAATSKLEEIKEQFLVEKTRMESEIASLKREAEIRLEGLGESRNGLQQDKTKLVCRVEQLEKELLQSKELCNDLKTEQLKLESSHQHLEAEKTRYEKQLEQMRDEKCSLEEEVTRLNKDVAALEKQANVQGGDLSAELTSQKELARQIETKLNETQQVVEELEKELETLEREKEEERVNFQKLNEESTKAFNKLEKGATNKNADMDELTNEIEAIAGDLEGEQQARQHLEELLEQKEKEASETIQDLELQVECITADLQGERHLREDLEKKMKMAETKTGENVQELQARADSITVDLEREQQLHQASEEKFQQNKAEMGEKVSKAQAEADNLAAALQEEQRLRKTVEKQLKQKQSDLKESSEELQSQIETLEDKVSLADTAQDMLQKRLDETQETVESLSSDKAEALKKTSEAAKLLSNNKIMIDELNQTMASLREELHGKQLQLAETQAQLKLTETERKDAVARMESFDLRENELYRKLRESDRIRRDLHNKVMQLSGNIRVYVRVRPELPGEKEKEIKLLDAQQPENSRKRKAAAIEETPFKFPGIFDRNDEETGEDLCKNLMEVTEPHKDRGGLKERRKKWKFGFDNVFTPSHGQEEIWEATDPLVQSAIDGYNVCLFAYGQTGSGKTYTMLGDQSNKGIITRAVAKLFDAKTEIESLSKGKTSVSINVELLEIYNEKVRDLMSPESTLNQNLKVTSNNVEGAVLVSTASSEDVMEILEVAQSRRCVKATKSNSESSRSHMVFTIHFDVTTDNGVSRKGKLHVCDLAGSERLGKSGANASAGGSLLKETKAINSSLSVLSNVIEKLQKGNTNVPFRESKLTMLLSGSLGGNSKTLAIVCCNPLASHFHESLCSLRFAEKVNQVELKASSNFSC